MRRPHWLPGRRRRMDAECERWAEHCARRAHDYWWQLAYQGRTSEADAARRVLDEYLVSTFGHRVVARARQRMKAVSG